MQSSQGRFRRLHVLLAARLGLLVQTNAKLKGFDVTSAANNVIRAGSRACANLKCTAL